MRLCITSIVKTLTDNHALDDRNHKGHHTTLLLSETLLSTAQASLCVDEVRSLESTPSDMSRCLASSGQHLVDGEGSPGSSSGSSRMVCCSSLLTKTTTHLGKLRKSAGEFGRSAQGTPKLTITKLRPARFARPAQFITIGLYSLMVLLI